MIRESRIIATDGKLTVAGEYIKAESSYENTLFVALGVKKVRLICFSEQFIPHIEKQLTYTLCKDVSDFDATIILWQENDIEHIHENECLFGETSIKHIIIGENSTTLICPEKKTYFYGAKDLSPEEFVKEGHIFVQIFNKILKTENTALVHGACAGLDNKGVLFCARGQRGKSTLTVLSLLNGFEYVSDDYLTLEKDGKNLYAYPIYSIITLSPKMYSEMYEKLDGTRFISNNARKDKYVLNISNLHNQCKKKYPVKLCMSLDFTEDEKPSIVECSKQEKGSAATQMVHSTLTQMHDMKDIKTVKKIIDMISDFDFYKINLCNNIHKNVKLLRKFLTEYKDD